MAIACAMLPTVRATLPSPSTGRVFIREQRLCRAQRTENSRGKSPFQMYQECVESYTNRNVNIHVNILMHAGSRKRGRGRESWQQGRAVTFLVSNVACASFDKYCKSFYLRKMVRRIEQVGYCTDLYSEGEQRSAR